MTPDTLYFLVLFLTFRTEPTTYPCPTGQCVSQLVDQYEPRGLFKAWVFGEKPMWQGSQIVTAPLAEYLFN